MKKKIALKNVFWMIINSLRGKVFKKKFLKRSFFGGIWGTYLIACLKNEQ
jgi:hypothetical protein